MSEKKKIIDEMTDHELMMEIVRSNQKRSLMLTVLIITAICAMLVIIVYMSILIPQMKEAAETINQLAEQGQTSLEQLDKIDFEQLNTAITDFAKVAAKLAQWFK